MADEVKLDFLLDADTACRKLNRARIDGSECPVSTGFKHGVRRRGTGPELTQCLGRIPLSAERWLLMDRSPLRRLQDA